MSYTMNRAKDTPSAGGGYCSKWPKFVTVNTP